MRDLYYGDRRDRVKWGALAHLAERHGLETIIQVAYLRKAKGEDKVLQTDGGPEPIAEAVWRHFSDLRGVRRLAAPLGKRVEVVDSAFDASERASYIERALAQVRTLPPPRLLFLDPDTGIEPQAAKAEHVLAAELQQFWKLLNAGEVLALYQHAGRTSGWLEVARAKVAPALGSVGVHDIQAPGIAKDIAVLWVQRGPGA